MAACDMEKQQHQQEQDLVSSPAQPSPIQEGFMQKFRLYQTLSKFYMIGRDKSRTYWRVLKIDRTEPSELHMREDSTTYTERECSDLLRRINEGNRSTGGLKFVTTCYGIVGFIKFLGPYYMLLITKRRQIGAICGHTVYAITKSEMIPLPNAATRSKIVNFRSENRYRKLLCMVDLTKDFFFSYSYHVMRSLQKNMCDNDTGPDLYDSMFVWNEYMTRGTRNLLHNTIWTVALVYGFFKQGIKKWPTDLACGVQGEPYDSTSVLFLFSVGLGLILRMRSNLFGHCFLFQLLNYHVDSAPVI